MHITSLRQDGQEVTTLHTIDPLRLGLVRTMAGPFRVLATERHRYEEDRGVATVEPASEEDLPALPQRELREYTPQRIPGFLDYVQRPYYRW